MDMNLPPDYIAISFILFCVEFLIKYFPPTLFSAVQEFFKDKIEIVEGLKMLTKDLSLWHKV